MTRIISKYFIFVFILLQLNAQAQKGKIIQTPVPAHSLANDLYEVITEKSVIIYLPPSYDSSGTRYPVVYFLPGFGTRNTDFLNGAFQGYKLNDSMDNLIAQNKIREMMVVVPDGINFMQGSFYVNSPAGGNWEDFIVDDLVNYIDENYRTIPDADSRGIAGHSMGGFGALNLAMLHPEVFHATYGLCPGLFDTTGLKDQGMFSQSMIDNFLSRQQEGWSSMREDSALTAFKGYINNRIAVYDFNTYFAYAYAAAFSSNPEQHAPYIDYPYSKNGEQIVCDSTVLKNYENGFGGLSWKIEQYKENLLKLKGIAIDYGTKDFYTWIQHGCIYFSNLLTDAEIPHELLNFNSGHNEMVRSRIENSVMPFFFETLIFDSLGTEIQLNGNVAPSEYRLSNYPNPFNGSTTIVVKIPKSGLMTMKVYDLIGKEIDTLVNAPCTSGEFKFNWKARGCASGIYLTRVQVDDFTRTNKMIYQK